MRAGERFLGGKGGKSLDLRFLPPMLPGHRALGGSRPFPDK